MTSFSIPSTPAVRSRTRPEPNAAAQLGLPAYLAPKVIERPIDEIRPSDRNARTHGDSQITKIIASMTRFGLTCMSS